MRDPSVPSPRRIALASALTCALAAPSAFSAAATVTDYTVCKIEDAAARSAWAPRCQRATDPATLTLNVTRNGRDAVVVDMPAQNCRPSENHVYGGVSLVVDSSRSVVTTDPANDRLDAAKELLDKIADDAEGNTTVTTADADYPRVGVVSYGGRQGTDNGYEADGLNTKYTERFCIDGDAQAAKFDSSDARARWQEKNAAGTLLSICEFLRPVLANDTALMKRHDDFMQYTGSTPRGGTDLSHFSEAIGQPTMLGNSTARARNGIVITDGLPNIPKYVPAEECRATEYLKNEKIEKVADKNGTLREVCIYRQAQFAADKANGYLETNAAKFAGINQYNVLFAPQDKVYFDLDKKGRINPPDFLIENSARTGNGKVKFAWATNKGELTKFVEDTLKYKFDKASLQRVTVKVNERATYNAVSPADTSDTNKVFSIKLVGLKDGANSVVVTYVYSDSEVPRTYTVNVAASGGTVTSPFTCTQGLAGKTVDGDDPRDLDPDGDGVLPPKDDGSYQRVYRNADAENKYDRDALNSSGSTEVTRPDEVKPGEKDPRDLRLQGGTGNCGVVGGAKLGGHSGQGAGLSWNFALLLSPLLLAIGAFVANVTRKMARQLRRNFR